MKTATKSVLQARLAAYQIASYPELYKGFADHALYYAKYHYPTKSAAELACYCFNLPTTP